MAIEIPTELSAALAARRTALLERARGRVLDIGDSGLAGAEGHYDTIYSFVQTPGEPDLDAYAARIRELLAPDGMAYFLEPTIRTGPLGRALGFGGKMMRPMTGLYLDRDVPQAVRRAGLFITDLHRFEIASVAAPLRPFVEAWARFPTPSRSEPS